MPANATDLPKTAIPLPMREIGEFCARWGVESFALFGSILRDDFGPESDVDVLVEFTPGLTPGVYAFMDMKDELGSLLGRRVDLIPRDAVEASRHASSRKEIIQSAMVVCAK